MEFQSFTAAQSTPMGWEEGEFRMHMYSSMDLQVYFYFSILESVLKSLITENSVDLNSPTENLFSPQTAR